jgi:hypothetical protein
MADDSGYNDDPNAPAQPPRKIILPDPEQLVQLMRQTDLGIFQAGLERLYQDSPVTYRLLANFLASVAYDTAAYRDQHGE